MHNISSLGSAGSFSHNCIQMEETNGEAGKDPLWNPDSVPKRTRSELRQRILSPVERLHRQLYINLQEPDFEDIAVDDETVTLIYAPNKYIPPNEIGLGAMLLVSPTTTTEHSTSISPMAEDNASRSMNVPVEKLLLSPTTTTKRSVSPSPMAEDNASRSMNVPVEKLLLSPTTTTERSPSPSPVAEDNASRSMNVPVEKLLVSPTTTTERSASPSPMAEDNASRSMNVPVEKLLLSPTTTTERSASPSPMAEDNAYRSLNVPVEKLFVSPTTATERSTSPSPMAEDNASRSMNVPVEKLLLSPTTTTERSVSPSPMAEDNAYRSLNVPVEKLLVSPTTATERSTYLINNNVQVAMQTETTGNESGKPNELENRLSPPHLDTTSRVSGQTLNSQRAHGGGRRGRPPKMPRGRPRLSTTQGRYPDKDGNSGTADGS